MVVIVCSQVARLGRSLQKLPCEIPISFVLQKNREKIIIPNKLNEVASSKVKEISLSVCKMVKLAAENSVLLRETMVRASHSLYFDSTNTRLTGEQGREDHNRSA